MATCLIVTGSVLFRFVLFYYFFLVNESWDCMRSPALCFPLLPFTSKRRPLLPAFCGGHDDASRVACFSPDQDAGHRVGAARLSRFVWLLSLDARPGPQTCHPSHTTPSLSHSRRRTTCRHLGPSRLAPPTRLAWLPLTCGSLHPGSSHGLRCKLIKGKR